MAAFSNPPVPSIVSPVVVQAGLILLTLKLDPETADPQFVLPPARFFQSHLYLLPEAGRCGAQSSACSGSLLNCLVDALCESHVAADTSNTLVPQLVPDPLAASSGY